MTAATPGQAAYDPLPDIAALVRAGFDYDTIGANIHAERIAEYLGLTDEDDGTDDYRPSMVDADTALVGLREALAAQEPHAADGGRSFEDMLADPREQFDLRSELLASISEYAAAPPASAGIKPWHPDGVPQPAPGLAALRQAAARELVTAADRDQLSAELGKLKQLLDDFTHAVIDLDDGARLVKTAHAVREKAGLPVIDQFSHPAGPPS